MFTYFGSKANLAHLYPNPQYDRIIEPFAGAANYACRYPDFDVWLNEKDRDIAMIWKWLRGATRKDIMGLPVLKTGQRISRIRGLSEPERNLLKLICQRGTAGRGDKVTRWASGERLRPRPGSKQRKDPSAVEHFQRRILPIIGRISHWRVTCGDYSRLPNGPATWFIDPPYQKQGKNYRWSNKDIDYGELSEWCLEREGQLIVCEAEPAFWLPFRSLRFGTQISQSKARYRELLYYRSDKTVGLERVKR